jgi:hypothetical protein
MAKKKILLPWERQPGEGSEAFGAFIIYRDATPKISAEKVGEKYGKNKRLTERWCTKFRWKDRREAWEDERDRATRQELVKGSAAMLKKHIDIAAALQFKALQGMQHLPATGLTAFDIVKMLDLAVKVERLSRGEVTEKTETKTEVTGDIKVANLDRLDLANLSEMELGQLDELVSKIAPD